MDEIFQLAKVMEKSTLPPQEVIGAKSKVKITMPGSWVVKENPNENIVLKLFTYKNVFP